MEGLSDESDGTFHFIIQFFLLNMYGSFSRAAMTKYHMLGGLNNGNLLSNSSRG